MRVFFAARNYLSGTVQTVLTLLVGVITTPFIIRMMGSEAYGSYRIILDCLGYLTLLDLGIHEALIPQVVESLATGEKKATFRALSVGLKAYLRMLPSKCIAAILLAFLIPKIFTLTSEADHPSVHHYLACAFAFVWYSLVIFNPFRIYLEARQKGYQIHLLLSLQAVLASIFSAVLVWRGYGLLGMFIGLALSGIIYVATLLFLVRSELGNLRHIFFERVVDEKVWKSLWHLNWSAFASSLCSRLSYLSDSIILALVHGAGVVTPVVVSQRVIGIAQAQITNIGTASWAGLAELWHQKDEKAFSDRVIELTQMTATLGAVLLGSVIVLNRPLLWIWMGEKYYTGDFSVFIFCMNALFVALVSLWSWVFTALKKANILLKQFVIFTLLNIALSFYFTHRVVYYGPALGSFCSALLVSLWVIPLLLRKNFGVSGRKVVWAAIRPWLILAFPILALYFSERAIHIEHWIPLILAGPVVPTILGFFAWKWVINKEEKQLWQDRFRRVFSRA